MTKNEVTLEDGRTFTFKREKGVPTVLPTGERCYYYESCLYWYLGEHWEFTGRLKYQSNPDWEETYCYVEVIHVWEENHWIIPFKKVIQTEVKWLGFGEIKYDYATTETIVECEET